MPIERPEIPESFAECDECGLRTPFDDEANEEEGDTGLPLGWVYGVAKRRMINPRAAVEVNTALADAQAAAMAQAKDLEVPDEALEGFLGAAVAQAMMFFQPQEPPEVIQTIEFVLDPEHAGLVQARLGTDDWSDGFEEGMDIIDEGGPE